MDPFPVRVLVVHAEHDAREALVATLERAGLEVAGVASDASAAIETARRTSPAVALVAAGLPGDGVVATREIVGGANGCRVVALSRLGDGGAVLQMLLAGAVGYAAEGAPSDELLATVQRAARTEPGLSVDAMRGLMEELLHELADRSEIEQRLRRSEEKFRGLLEAAPDAAVVADRQGRIVLVNLQTEMMFGYARDGLLGQHVEFLLPERFHRSHVEHRLEYLGEPHARRMGAITGLAGRRMDGTEFPVDVGLSTLETDEGTLTIAFVRDLSQRLRPRGVDGVTHGHGARPDVTVRLESRAGVARHGAWDVGSVAG